MNWHRWLATLLIMLALAGCAQGSQVPYAPYSPEYIYERAMAEEVAAAVCSGSGQSNLASPLYRSRDRKSPLSAGGAWANKPARMGRKTDNRGNSVWNSCRGNHLGQRSCGSAQIGWTYGRKRSDQSTAKHLARRGLPHMENHWLALLVPARSSRSVVAPRLGYLAKSPIIHWGVVPSANHVNLVGRGEMCSEKSRMSAS
jgi:hypothetical protein